MRRLLILVVGLGLLGGCHHRFRRHVDDLSALRPEVGPVEREPVLVYVDRRKPARTALDAFVEPLDGIDPMGHRLDEALDRERLREAFHVGVVDGLDHSERFTPSASAAHTLVAVPGHLTLTARSGDKTAALTCSLSVHIEDPSGAVLYRAGVYHRGPAVGTIPELERLDDAALQAMFERLAATCGAKLVDRMVEHVGRAGRRGEGPVAWRAW